MNTYKTWNDAYAACQEAGKVLRAKVDDKIARIYPSGAYVLDHPRQRMSEDPVPLYQAVLWELEHVSDGSIAFEVSQRWSSWTMRCEWIVSVRDNFDQDGTHRRYAAETMSGAYHLFCRDENYAPQTLYFTDGSSS